VIRDLLVRISGYDQTQRANFCWSEGIISRMLRDFARGFEESAFSPA
jgi:hypothetical protein